jgi:hypothetical protein
MKGIIICDNNYTYDGSILDDEPHGYGTYRYKNGDKYIGESKLGKLDGFGTYKYGNGSSYTGYFSENKFHGIGTFDTKDLIYKGTWRQDKKHGSFYNTEKNTYNSYLEHWKDNELLDVVDITYIPATSLETSKVNPKRTAKKSQSNYRGNEKKCIGCYENGTNSTNSACGHVCMCYNCLIKCDRCPICRCPINNVVKLFIS